MENAPARSSLPFGLDYKGLLVLLLIIVVIVLAGLGIKSTKEISLLQSRINALETEAAAQRLHINEVFAYSGKLSIKVLSIQKTDDDMLISGTITNSGARKIKDVELTVYCLDENDRPFLAHTYSAVSSDGKPIGKQTDGVFRVSVPCILKDVKDFTLFISDIHFL